MKAGKCPTDELSVTNCAIVNPADFQPETCPWVRCCLRDIGCFRLFHKAAKATQFKTKASLTMRWSVDTDPPVMLHDKLRIKTLYNKELNGVSEANIYGSYLSHT